MTETKERLISLADTGLTDDELFTRIPQDEAAVEKITAPRYSYWHSVFRVFFRKKANIIILLLFAVIIVFTYIYPLINGFDRYGNLMDADTKHLTPAAAIEKFGFSIRWIFGTGASGQSTFDSMWYGARISLSLAFLCAVINFSIGIVVGAVWGFSKKVDLIMNEIRNVVGNVPGTLIISVWVLVFSPQLFYAGVCHVCHRMDRRGLLSADPGHYYPRPRVQSGIQMPGIFHAAHCGKKHSALHDLLYRHDFGNADPGLYRL